MKYQNTSNAALEYVAPVTESVQIVSENFLMQSNLEDYGDNPIYGLPFNPLQI